MKTAPSDRSRRELSNGTNIIVQHLIIILKVVTFLINWKIKSAQDLVESFQIKQVSFFSTFYFESQLIFYELKRKR